MFSGAYPCELIEDVVFCVEGKMIPRGGDKFDVGCGDAFGGGEAEDLDDAVDMVINVVETHRLQQTTYDKKSFMAYIKGYMARIKAVLEKSKPDRVAPFMKGAETIVKKILGKFDDYDFFLNESMDFEAGVAIRFYNDVTPYFYFFRDGLVLGFPGFGKNIDKEALVPVATALKQGFVI